MFKLNKNKISFGLEYLKPILDNTFDEIAIIDKERRINYCNKKFCLNHKIKEEEAIGSHCYKIIHKSDEICNSPDIICPIEEVLKTEGINKTIHTHYVEGTPLILEQFTFPIRTKDNIIYQLCKIGKNITEFKKKDQKIKESDEKLKKLKESKKKYQHAYYREEFKKKMLINGFKEILNNLRPSTELIQLYLGIPEKVNELKEIWNLINKQIIRGINLILSSEESSLKEN